MRFLKRNEVDMDVLPCFNFRGYVYAPTTHNGRVYHTVYNNFQYVTDLNFPANAVLNKREFIEALQAKRYV